MRVRYDAFQGCLPPTSRVLEYVRVLSSLCKLITARSRARHVERERAIRLLIRVYYEIRVGERPCAAALRARVYRALESPSKAEANEEKHANSSGGVFTPSPPNLHGLRAFGCVLLILPR